MNAELIEKIKRYVVERIGDFHDARLVGLNKLKLTSVLKRKNLYLFRAKNQVTANDIVKGILDSYISSSEETVFGDWLEGLAIFVAGEVFGGKKSSAAGIDLEMDRDGIHYLVSIKSGPNWGNSGQLRKMENDFKTATRILHTSKSRIHVEAVNGCCYGRDSHPDKGAYRKLCGQDFWEFVSGEPDLYLAIIEPLSEKAKEKNEAFMRKYVCKLNLFVKEFLKDYSLSDGSIDWEKLVKMNSGRL